MTFSWEGSLQSRVLILLMYVQDITPLVPWSELPPSCVYLPEPRCSILAVIFKPHRAPSPPILKHQHPATNHSKHSLIKSNGCTSEVGMLIVSNKLHRSIVVIHRAQGVLSSPSIAQNPARATLSTPASWKKSGLKCCVVLLQFGKDVINFRSRAKIVQENSVHFWSEIFLRYWIVLGNKATGSVKCLILSLSYPPCPVPVFMSVSPFLFLQVRVNIQKTSMRPAVEFIWTLALRNQKPYFLLLFHYKKTPKFSLLRGC